MRPGQRGSLLHGAIDLWQTCDIPRMDLRRINAGLTDHSLSRRLAAAPSLAIDLWRTCDVPRMDLKATVARHRTPPPRGRQLAPAASQVAWKPTAAAASGKCRPILIGVQPLAFARPVSHAQDPAASLPYAGR